MENNHVHNFKATKISATCKERGYTLYKCDCGYEHKEDFTPLGQHNYLKSEERQPTCTEDGFLKYTCEFCGECSTSVIPKKGHCWSQWQVQKIATCTEEGSQYRICQTCGYREDAVVPAKGHDIEKEGKTYFCRNCGETIEKPSFFKKHKKSIVASIISAIVILLLVILTFVLFIPMYYYNKAKDYIAQEDYESALQYLEKCNGYSDSEQILERIYIVGYKKVTERNYNISGYKYYFDEKGNRMTGRDQRKSQGTYKYEYTYDENNNLLSKTEYGIDGEIEGKYEYTYGEDGKLALEIRDSDSGKTEYKYDYDLSNNKMFKTYLTGGESEYQYDEKGNMVYMKDPYDIEYRYEYIYNETGNVLSEIKYTGDKKISRYEYNYDESGNLLSKTEYDAESGKLRFKYEYTYDNKRNILTETSYYGEKSHFYFKYVYSYDKYGKKTAMTEYGLDGSVQGTTEFIYEEPIWDIKTDK